VEVPPPAEEDEPSDPINLINSPLLIRDDENAEVEEADCDQQVRSPPEENVMPPRASAEAINLSNLSNHSSADAQLSENSKGLQEELLRLSQLDSTFPPPVKYIAREVSASFA
jgi:hypothetical protein